jgi:hypothetical protein
MQLQVGDRLADETGEWEVIGPPYTTTHAGKNARVCLKRVANAEVMMIRTGARRERIAVKRQAHEEDY